MRHLFVMDPLHRLNVGGDSTYVTMREASDRDHKVWWCEPSGLFALDGRAKAVATEVVTGTQSPFPFKQGQTREIDLSEVDVVWMRKDPPFDMSYVFTTYLLDMVPPETLVVNDPAGLKLFNEKMWAARFPELHPSTLITNDIRRLRSHIEELGRAVIKPWDGNGGRGVLVTGRGDRNLGSMLEILTAEGRDYVLCQPFLEGVEDGDKRILLFDGEPVGQMLRIPSAKDFRGNMHVGASVQSCDLDARDLQICATLGPELKKWGQVFVGIDVIDGLLTEINVTSPTGIRELNHLDGTTLEADLVDCVQSALARHRETA